MDKCVKWKKAAVVMLSAICVFMGVCPEPVRAAKVDMNMIVSAAAEILYDNEGSYNSVNANDNGAVSIGKLQWHGWRALSLLKTIVSENESQAKKLLGNTLYNEIKSVSDTSKWSTRTFTSEEAAAVRKLLATDESKAAQDVLAVKDVTSYIEQGQRLGISNEPALVYFADLANQGGAGAAGRVASSASKVVGGYSLVTLNEIHEAAICDTVMGSKAYQNRRIATYKYAAELGWTYCSQDDSYIPGDYVSARDYGTEWVQRALNTCMKAGLAVTNTYDEATKAAVKQFQSAKSLTADGYTGKETMIALIKAVFKEESVVPGTDLPEEPDPLPEEPEIPGSQDPIENPEKPDVPVSKPSKKTILQASKASYAVNDTHEAFQLRITSNHTQTPITYQSENEAVVVVNDSGEVNITGAGKTKITVSQEASDTYQSAQLTIAITIYSTTPSDYAVPAGALYAGKNMKQEDVQWLQAALLSLGETNSLTVNGSWSKTMTKLVTDFQKKCGLQADGIAGDMTKDMVKKMLAVKEKKPTATVKGSTAANTVSWKKYAKANRVYIFRKEKGGTYKRVKTITNMKKTSYQDTSAKKGITYTYTVQYGIVQNKMTIKSSLSKGVTGVRK